MATANGERSGRSRGNGEGSIYQRKADGRWCCSLTLDSGKRKVIYGKTRDEVARKLRMELNARDEGTVTTGSMTLARFVPEYLTAVELRNVRPRTLEAYSEKLDKHILPRLGMVRLDKLTAAHVEQLYATLRKEGRERKRADGTVTKVPLSPGTVGMVHQVLHQVLKLAKRRHLVGRIVTDDVDPPKRQKFHARPLNAAEATALLRAIRDHGHGPLWTFLLGAGVRFGEAAGLTWSAVDLDAGTAEILQAVTRRRQDGKVRLTIDAVKTEAGNRVVALPSWAVAALRAQRARIAEMRLLAGSLWEDQDLVFPNRLGKPLAENHVLVTWHRAIEAANRERGPNGLPKLPKIRMHDLRHTKGTIMADEGEELVVIQRTLGHARQSITADLYIGKAPKAQRRAADRFGELLDPGREAAG